jgi:hypothetical protein
MPVIIDGTTGITSPAAALTTPLPVASGGTGASSLSGITTGTATNIAGGSNGTIPYQSASGTTQMLAVGTSGQVLQTNGAGAPTWATQSAGAMVFISVTTVSGTPSTLDITSGISATYDDYVVIFENAALSANAAKLQMLLYKSGAFQENSYNEVYIHFDATGLAPVVTGDSVTFTISRQALNVNTNLRSGTINLYNLNSTTAYASGCTWSSQNTGSSGTGANNVFTIGGGTEATAAVVTQLRFRPSTGTFTSGTFRLYGIQKS